MSHKLTYLAFIHIGSELISFRITEYRNDGRKRTVEEAVTQVRLGEETFKNKRLSHETVANVCELLKGFKKLMKTYEVEKYSAVATTAVREAENRFYLLDQIYIKTGIKVTTANMPYEIYTKFIVIKKNLELRKIGKPKDNYLYADISSGGLGITFVSNGKIKYQQNLHLGIIRIKEAFAQNQRSNIHFAQALTEYISSFVDPVRLALKKEEIKYLVLSGAESEMILRILGREVGSKKPEVIPLEEFLELYNRTSKYNLPQIMKIFGINESLVEIVYPTVILYHQLLAIAPVKSIVIAKESFLDGMELLKIGYSKEPGFARELKDGLLSLTRSIAEKYKYDAKHAKQVENIALVFFDKLKNRSGLKENHRVLLRAACILHDIGKFTCLRSHTDYSYQIIKDTDFMGFTELDKTIVALTVYYHSHTLTNTYCEGIPRVPTELVPLIGKLATILRLADALDRSYGQKITDCKISISKNDLIVKIKANDNIELEDWTFKHKAYHFTDVYGLNPILKLEGE